ncbi:acetolactate synthase large subunit [Candidatus Woesearchaeota archaeon]|nr:acetolactate synthase large subunit [Candidatus Woesearchaeota archaeon]
MKASDLFVKCLVNEEVEYIFSVPGEENLDLLESLRKTKIKIIINRHEQVSAFMAATYGRLTGKVGVCMATLGPGATNLITGIAHGQLGGMPMLSITGQKGVRDNLQANFQVLDIVNMFKPITKHSVQIVSPKNIPKEIRNAFKLSTSERQGATHIELPEDIAIENINGFIPQKKIQIRRPIAEKKSINFVVDEIKKAKNPIIIISSRAQRNRVRDSIKSFCNKTNIYAIHTQLGKGVLGDDHKNSLYTFGIHKKDYVNCVVDRSDLLIMVGYNTVEHPPSVWNKNRNKKIIHIDFVSSENDTYYDPIVEVIGDIAESISMISKQLGKYSHDGNYELKIKKKLNEILFMDGTKDNSFPIKPRKLIKDIRTVMGKKDIICLDNGIYKMWFSRHYPAYDIGTVLLDNTLATMGAGMPSALAAKLVDPKKKILAVCGDGGFMMNSQDLATAVKYKINIVVLILNDNAYGFIKWKQKNHGFSDFALDLNNPNFVKYAQSYGAKGFEIKSSAELIPTLKKAFLLNKPVIIDCKIDYSENFEIFTNELNDIKCNY